MAEPLLLEVKDLNIEFHDHLIPETVVYDFDLELKAGEIVGLVGESGSGKSMSALAIAGLLSRRDMHKRGQILFDGLDLLTCERSKLRKIQGNEISMIFQEPMTSLNPVKRIGWQIEESLRIHTELNKEERYQKAIEMMKEVELPDPERLYRQYPHELSGGMRQRVMIAAAMICNPRILIADEPTTALDVTIQAQVLELMKQLIRDKEMSMLMITHDLGVVAEVCEDVAVMYAGRIVQKGTADDVFNHMRHPYTEGLFDSLPNLKQRGEELVPIKGLMPDPSDLPPGCAFAPRCPYATEACTKAVPELTSVEGSATHFVACSAYKDPEFRLGENKDGR